MEKLGHYLDAMIKEQAVDLYLIETSRPSIRRSDSYVTALRNEELTKEEIKSLLGEILDEKSRVEFATNLELDTSTTYRKTRFRVSCFKHKQDDGIVIRRVRTDIPEIKSLGLPEIYNKIVMQNEGLVILASPTGSGKSTSMAAMVGHRNKHSTGHIVTVEDPIEYIHEHGSCLVTQREVGIDTKSYSAALQGVLRQRADVVVVGEARNAAVMEYAFKFSEAGHLCLTTLHANGVVQAIERVANMFPIENRNAILFALSSNLVAILSQKFIPKKDGGMIPITEVLVNKGIVKKYIREDEMSEILDLIERKTDPDMHTFDDALIKLFRNDIITIDTAMSHAKNPSKINLEGGLEDTETIKKQEKVEGGDAW